MTFSHLHIQFQDVCVSLQQLAQVGIRSAEVSVDKLFDVTVGGALRSFFVSLQVSDKIQGKVFYQTDVIWSDCYTCDPVCY